MNTSMSVYNNQNGFLNSPYPKILSYSPNSRDGNKYIFTIKDIEISCISKIELKITLPEIKGIGKVYYLNSYPFHLIKSFGVYVKNPEDEVFKEQELLTGEDLLHYMYSSNKTNSYSIIFGSEMDDYCKVKEGKYNDHIIFPSKEITIPINVSNSKVYIFPHTAIEFRVCFYGLEEIISVNTEFHEKSLQTILREYERTSKNVKLQFTNTHINYNNSNSDVKISPLFKNIETTTHENLTDVIVSEKFKTAKNVSFHTKSNIFSEDNMKFIIPFGPKYNEETFINSWVNRILKDLIIVTDKDLNTKDGKEMLGFVDKCNFEKIENNTIWFDKERDMYCKIYINNVPDTHNVYYHRNILTFTRRMNKHNVLNISNLFSFIQGTFFEYGAISFDKINHSVEIYHVSIPINIWNDQTNTAYGDLRSLNSKVDDFYYKNKFILGMDILSKDTGYESVSLLSGRDLLLHSYDKQRDTIVDYPNRIEFFTDQTSPDHYILADDNINFNNFIININWKKYNEFDPVNLYKRIPSIIVSHVFNIEYDLTNSLVHIFPK